MSGYRGRFAPSPTGPLHAGSLVAALASWLDARAHGGEWLVRIEDVDKPRCVPGADEEILRSSRLRPAARRAAGVAVAARGAVPGRARPPGGAATPIPAPARARTSRRRCARRAANARATASWSIPAPAARPARQAPARAWRFRVPRSRRRCTGPTAASAAAQDVAREVGDFVLKRADGLFAYQLAVVVDDADQGITHVVRGEDLADNTPRQLLLQRALGCRAGLPAHAAGAGRRTARSCPSRTAPRPLDLRRSAAGAQRRGGGVLGLQVPAGWPTPGRLARPGRGAIAGGDNPGMSDDQEHARERAPSARHPQLRARAGRTTVGQARALETLGPQYLLPYQPHAGRPGAGVRPRGAHRPGDRLRHGRGHGAHRRR
jgi:glutamyl-Q tRNA(Asp) synthetase